VTGRNTPNEESQPATGLISHRRSQKNPYRKWRRVSTHSKVSTTSKRDWWKKLEDLTIFDLSRPEEILYEAELLRFKPGIEKDFIPRYVQVTTRAFRYFENRFKS